MERILISACLVGQKVRYDGEDSKTGQERIERWHQEGRLVAVCPEVAGGLGVPRPAAEIVGGDGQDVLDGDGRLVTEEGEDVTDAFVSGAQHALKVARKHQIRLAVLKSKSPSCGARQIYDGSFTGVRRDGMGVTAALLRRNGIAVFNEGELDEAARVLQRLEDVG